VIRSLRKGQSSVYLQYGSIGETIGAKEFEAELRGNVAVLRFTLNPVDGNQRSDARRLFEEALREVHLSDNYVVDRLTKFLEFREDSVHSMELEIFYQGKTLRYSMGFGESSAHFIPLLVEAIAS
jgi:hypothetical protein